MSAFQMWDAVWNNSWVIGDFVWTSLDYLGESSIGFETQTELIDECDATKPFPFHVSFCGDLDIAGSVIRPRAPPCRAAPKLVARLTHGCPLTVGFTDGGCDCGALCFLSSKRNPKPQAAYRSVLWGRSRLEVAVHAPIPVR